MSAASDLTQASWQAFSRLLDEALELPPTERLGWLERLGAEHDAVKPALRAVLARADGVETAQWLATLPRGAALPPLDGSDLQMGSLVGPYRLLRELGVGGMGTVCLAERADGTLKRQVALKLPRTAWTRGLAERMARERDILAALEHPNIARLYDAGTDAQGRPYLALEYVEGQPIDAYCAQQKLPVRARVELLLQVAHAVAFAHSRLVVHRDLKPSNILVTADGQVRLLDFGIAKLLEGNRAAETQLTQLAGRALTPDYASPEQIRGDPIGTASDVYSLGVVAFELLAGVRPYKLKRGSAAEVEEAVLAADVPLASSVATDVASKRALRGDLDAILAQVLRKDVVRRYASVEALADDLGRHLAGQPVTARPDSRAYRLRKFVARNRVVVAAGVSVALALTVGAGLSVWQARVATEQARRAELQRLAAERESKRAQAVQQFLSRMILSNTHLQNDPAKARATTARELLDIGAQQIRDALKDQPEAKLEVLLQMSNMYIQLGLPDEAIALTREGLAVAQQSDVATDTRVADWLLQLSQALQRESGHDAEVARLLDEARQRLDAAGEKTSFIRGALLYETARFERDRSLPRLKQAADAGVEFFSRYHPKRPTRINLTRLAGRARMFEFDAAGAEVFFRQACELARQQEKGAAAWLVGPLTDLAEAQWLQWKVAEAEASLREALEHSLAVNGPYHGETLRTSAKLAALHLRSGRLREGLDERARIERAMAESPMPVNAAVRADVGQLLAAPAIDLGQPGLARPALLADVEDLRKRLPTSGALAARLATLAEVEAVLGRVDAARALLAESERTWLAYVGDPPPPRVLHALSLSRARVALAAGAPKEALALMIELPRIDTAVALPELHGAAELVRAEAQIALGAKFAAIEAAERVLGHSRQREMQKSALAARAAAVLKAARGRDSS
jgi:serine/threonine-protein kinase